MIEKLSNLIKRNPYANTPDSLALHLVSNGVTIQQWIPVTERLPEVGESVLVYRGPDTLMNVDYMLSPGMLWGADPYYDDEMSVTHWMPLPEPPKEVGA